MPRKIFIGTWKMNLSLDDSMKLAYEYKELGLSNNDKIFAAAPSMVSLVPVQSILSDTNINTVAQNCSIKDGYGAFTGEVSAKMLKDAGTWGVILGHSERRIDLGESIIEVNTKVKNVLQNDMKAILCIGEELETRSVNKTNEFIEEQLFASIEGVLEDSISNLIIAYEPVWAISSSDVKRTPTVEEIKEVTSFIKNLVSKKYSYSTQSISVLYGGSVSPENAQDFIEIESVDGFLIGSSSLNSQKFKEIATLS